MFSLPIKHLIPSKLPAFANPRGNDSYVLIRHFVGKCFLFFLLFLISFKRAAFQIPFNNPESCKRVSVPARRLTSPSFYGLW